MLFANLSPAATCDRYAEEILKKGGLGLDNFVAMLIEGVALHLLVRTTASKKMMNDRNWPEAAVQLALTADR